MLERAGRDEDERVSAPARETLDQTSTEPDGVVARINESLGGLDRVSQWGALEGILLFADSDWRIRMCGSGLSADEETAIE